MQQLAPQVGLNPSQGALLPSSGESRPQAGSGLRETPDSNGEGQMAPSRWCSVLAHRLQGLVIQGGLGVSPPPGQGPWLVPQAPLSPTDQCAGAFS